MSVRCSQHGCALACHSLSRDSSVVETVLAVELDHQPLLEVVWLLTHNLGVRVFEDVRTAHLDVALARNRAESGLRAWRASR